MRIQIQIRSGQHAVAAYIRAEQMPRARSSVTRREFVERGTLALRPAGARQAPDAGLVARIQRDAKTILAVPPDPLFHLVGLAHRDAADDDACNARIEQALHVVLAAHTAAGLHGEPLGGRDLFDHAQIFERARFGAVEIDQMQPFRAGIGVVGGERVRVEFVARLLRIVALFQAHDAPGAQIDGGNDFHGHKRMKFSSSRAPTEAERSG